MGLLDILNGMQNGPRGPSEPSSSDPSAPPGKSGGMSPLTMAILALLAYKAVKHIGGGQSTAAPGGTPKPIPAPTPGAPQTTQASLPGGAGGLGDLLKGGLGGLLAGGAAGSILSGGLGDLLKQFQDNGHGDTANSWVSPGPNKSIDPNDLANALGADQISAAMSQSGLSRDELLQGLSQFLPEAVNKLTPDGRLPTEHEASRWI
ncbi:YidB family protein [Bradyrhizobium prioriisuperbiae]|uniref:YidB family protein n=1 Tax=Bradyrhizobium prioriisuperbiae TaxID=2854389 RepID=UPI0028ED5660|nr:YidB family protein [Bradyrhizobium prioritasuperba]